MVGSFELVSVLMRRARRFLNYARMALDKGDYDLACFCADQAAQLGLKAMLLRLAGYVPRTHGLRELLGELRQSLASFGRADLAARVESFTRENRDGLRRLDEAYVAGRYLAYEFEADEAREAIELAEEVLSLIEEVMEAAFNAGGNP
ncbi:DNA-binding protein [Candidatus Bathyarchaeota archaeon]|nr:MAG: DNA-binding protein [Candidatus Bathyarchaeota archaeon]